MKRIHKRLKIDPLYSTIILVIAGCLVIIILLKRLLRKEKPKQENLEELCRILNDNKDNNNSSSKKNSTKKKKTRDSKEYSKAADMTLKKNRSDVESLSHHPEENELIPNTISSPNLVHSKVLESSNTINELEDDECLDENERCILYALMSMVEDNKDIIRPVPIYSIEYIFETKCQTENGNADSVENLEFNQLILNACERTKNLDELQQMLILYNESIEKKIIIKPEVLILSSEVCLSVGENIHAAFFLWEMEKYGYQIPRRILDLFIKYPKVKSTLKYHINEHFKRNKSDICTEYSNISQFHNSSNNLILPSTNFYLSDPDYILLKSKLDEFRSINIINALQTLKVNVSPFKPRIKKKKIKIVPLKDDEDESPTLCDEDVSSPPTITDKKNSKSPVDIAPTTKTREVQEVSRSTAVQEEQEPLNIGNLKNINIKEIKEYIPKNFRIIRKECDNNNNN